MVLKEFKNRLGRNLINVPGWHTSRKIVVIESDDWGSVRMSSKQAYHALLKAGVPVDKDPYSMYDALASEDDLTQLFDVLCSVKDKNGNNAILTANSIVANPDFEKIERSGFTEYFYEPFIETLSRYPKHSRSFDLWKQGIEDKVFYPQLHGREHVNTTLWMQALHEQDDHLKAAFQYGVFGVEPKNIQGARGNYMAAFDKRAPQDLAEIPEIIYDASQLFKNIFGYKSLTFISPCYIWSDEVEKALLENSVKSLQGIRLQYVPHENKEGYSYRSKYTGKSNAMNQVYTVRNAAFEPTPKKESNKTLAITECLKGVERAFRWKKPAIITAHRVNFIGYLDEKNRDENLRAFQKTLQNIVKLWPDVEFLHSADLAKQILKLR